MARFAIYLQIFAQIIGNKPSETCSLTGILQGIAFICLLRNQKQCTSLPGSYHVFLKRGGEVRFSLTWGRGHEREQRGKGREHKTC